ncbi:MAG: tripartite tricarboxylate transporter substrate binding protein [Proteobacteria bacterium]|nr:tripartite tricarboxylate transporter substrate binding protein [Burkholderiales bacterium]
MNVLWMYSLAAVLCAPGGGQVAHAQGGPAKVMRIVVPFPPGGPSDYAARIVAQRLPEALGQTVIVENRPGASGVTGADYVARQPADGNTIVIANVGMITILPHLQKLPFDPLKDFTPITNLIAGPSFLLVHPSVPVRSVKEVIALAKKRPGELTFASASVGQVSHMNGELMKVLAGIDMLHVPYKGTAQVLPELLGGQVSMTFSTSIDNLQFVKAGRVRVLAVTGRQRLPMLPEVPTMAESGLPGFDSLNWNGLVGPAGLPKEVLARLNREIVRAINVPEVREKITAQGNFIIGDTPDEFVTYIRAEYAKWGDVVKRAKIRLE